MTQTHCGWCGGVIPESGGPGRPRRYCRRSHRQRAFEARRAGAQRGLGPDEALVPAETLAAWRDARYLLEVAVADVRADEPSTAPELRRALRELLTAAAEAARIPVEPRATGETV